MIKNLKSIRYLFIIVTVIFTFVSSGGAFGQDTKIQKAEAFEITRIYNDNNGELLFEQIKVDFKLVDYAPPARQSPFLRFRTLKVFNLYPALLVGTETGIQLQENNLCFA